MRSLITGVNGQDGSYLAELLLSKGYEVFGVVQPRASQRCLQDSSVSRSVRMITASVTDPDAMVAVVREVQPTECYHLAAQSFVLGDEAITMTTNVLGTWCVLAAVAGCVPDCRVFFAGSSEMIGNADTEPQTEQTPFRPRSLYGASKVAAYDLLQYYRTAHGMFACCGIMYNHESPRRPTKFVTRKITRAVARIRAGLDHELRLGNLDAVRDWGYAPDYVAAMWKMLQASDANDYVIASGKKRSVRDFVSTAFSAVGLDWREFVVVDQQFYRPAEEVPLVGCAAKAQHTLGWTPKKDFEAMVCEMVEADCKALEYTSA